MYRITFISLLVAGGLAIALPVFAAHDCPGNFSVMPGYRGGGGVCAQMGLNSRAGTCLPGQAYEILCDDASGGRYKTCQGPRRCDGRGGFDNRQGPGGPVVPPGYQGGGRPGPAGPGSFSPGPAGPGYGGGYYGKPSSRPGGGNNRGPQPQPQQPQPGGPGFNCTSWDFDNNRPCPPGRVNRDCRNGCDGY